MADNVAITEGSGKNIATDDVQVDGAHTQGQVQFMKLVDGTLNGTASIRVDIGAKANALRVVPANDITSDTYIGNVKLNAGAAAIGKLAANSGIDIGDVTLTAGTALVGKVSIDQVTANANEVVVKSGTITEASAADIKTAVEIMDDWDATQGSTVSSDGIQLMGAYDSTKPSAVSDGQSARVLVDSYGRLLPGVEPEWFNAVFDSANATAEGQVVKAATASKKIYIMSYVISSDIEGWIKLQDEDSNALTGKMWLKAGGGIAIVLPPGAPLILDVVNKALEVICEASGDVSVTVTGYLAV